MTIYKWIIDYIKKYSFITDTVIKGTTVYIYYNKNNKQKFKRLAYRASKNHLIRCIESIKKDIGYYEDRKNRIEEEKYKTKNNNEPVVRILW